MYSLCSRLCLPGALYNDERVAGITVSVSCRTLFHRRADTLHRMSYWARLPRFDVVNRYSVLEWHLGKPRFAILLNLRGRMGMPKE